MQDPTDTTVTAIFLSLLGGGGFVALLTSWMTRRKTAAETKLADANADNLIIGSALAFVNTLKAEVTDLRESIDKLEKKIEALEDHIQLQERFIGRLREALSGVKPNHPILAEKCPTLSL